MKTHETTDKEKLDEIMKQVREEQMRLHPEIYEPQKNENDD